MKLEGFPKETLVELAKMYAQNWQTLDGLWFRNVEARYRFEATATLNLKDWERQPMIEAEGIKWRNMQSYSNCAK